MKEFWETTVLGSLVMLGKDVVTRLPNLLAMTIIISAGLLLAWGLGHVFERLLRVIGLDHMCGRLGMNDALARGGVKADPSHIVGRAIYWAVLVFAVIAGLQALNLQPINQFAQALLSYIPHLLTAGLILAAGYLLSNFVSQAVLIAAVNAALPPARFVAACARWGVQMVAIAMALEQLGIAQHIVVVGFGIALGGVVMAGALAFGLGARDLAKEFLERQFGRNDKIQQHDDLTHL